MAVVAPAAHAARAWPARPRDSASPPVHLPVRARPAVMTAAAAPVAPASSASSARPRGSTFPAVHPLARARLVVTTAAAAPVALASSASSAPPRASAPPPAPRTARVRRAAMMAAAESVAPVGRSRAASWAAASGPRLRCACSHRLATPLARGRSGSPSMTSTGMACSMSPPSMIRATASASCAARGTVRSSHRCTPPSPGSSGVVMADFNGDGKPDLAVSHEIAGSEHPACPGRRKSGARPRTSPWVRALTRSSRVTSTATTRWTSPRTTS